MSGWHKNDAELFVLASSVYPRLCSLERRVAILLGSSIAAWLVVLSIVVFSEMKRPQPLQEVAAEKGDLIITGDVPKGH